jgi:hypothetical protein
MPHDELEKEFDTLLTLTHSQVTRASMKSIHATPYLGKAIIHAHRDCAIIGWHFPYGHLDPAAGRGMEAVEEVEAVTAIRRCFKLASFMAET